MLMLCVNEAVYRFTQPVETYVITFSICCVHFLADPIWSRLWHSVSSVVCRLSVTFLRIVAKRYVLAKNCLKEQIGLPPRLYTPRYQVGPPIPPLTGIIPYKRLCLFSYIRV